jgi:hypothetical protein
MCYCCCCYWYSDVYLQPTLLALSATNSDNESNDHVLVRTKTAAPTANSAHAPAPAPSHASLASRLVVGAGGSSSGSTTAATATTSVPSLDATANRGGTLGMREKLMSIMASARSADAQSTAMLPPSPIVSVPRTGTSGTSSATGDGVARTLPFRLPWNVKYDSQITVHDEFAFNVRFACSSSRMQIVMTIPAAEEEYHSRQTNAMVCDASLQHNR